MRGEGEGEAVGKVFQTNKSDKRTSMSHSHPLQLSNQLQVDLETGNAGLPDGSNSSGVASEGGGNGAPHQQTNEKTNQK